MSHLKPCILPHKNDILSRIEEILSWTKNEKKTWYDDPFLTSIATAVLLKLGHNDEDLNLKWIEDLLTNLEKTKKHLDSVTLFCAFCLGLLSLNYAKRKDRKETWKLAKELLEELSKLNWMNTPKTVAFLTLILNETDFVKETSSEVSVNKIERYLLNFIQQETLDLENLVYALFSLSLLKPQVVRNYALDHRDTIKKLTNHLRVELRALTLDALDKAEIPCAEETYQGIWHHFDRKHYGVVERSIIQRIISSVYGEIAGLASDQRDVRIKEEDGTACIEIDIAKSSLEDMITDAPPIDQISIVALSILWSNYDKLYLFSRRRFEEYNKLVYLEKKDTHVPVEKKAMSSISKKIFRCELGKILWKYGTLTFLVVGLLPLALSYITDFVTDIPSPWSNAIGIAVGLFFGVGSFLKWISSHAMKEYNNLKIKCEEFRSKGEWQSS